MLTVIICTYNRGDILTECLASVVSAYKSEYPLELLIVDNNSTDNTEAVSREYGVKHDYITYCQEKNQGLSYARNTGFNEAKYDWVLYLDDDATVAKDFFARAYFLMTEGGYECIGGLYLPWYKYGKPDWYKDEYGSNLKSYQTLSLLPDSDFASGGVFLIKKQLLIDHNGFDPQLGMTGETVAYGEEDDLQRRMRAGGTQIAYDPKLIIYHLVPKYKLTPLWFLKSSYNLGTKYLVARGRKRSKSMLFISIGIVVLQVCWHLLIYTPRLLFSNYSWESWVIDVFKKPAKWIGVIYDLLNQKSRTYSPED